MRLVVARIGRAHGIRGEVSIEVRTDVPERRFVPGAVLHVADRASGVPATLTLTGVRDHNGTLLLRFAEVPDRTAAEALRDVLLEADVPEEPEEADAWYDHQLVGLRAETPDGETIGAVVAVEHPPAQDLLVIRQVDGSDALVPFVRAIVPEIDVPAGRVVIDAPPGLLDGEAT